MQNKRLKKWWLYLLAIPAIFIADFILVTISMFIEERIADNNVNGNTPALSIITLFICFIITIILMIKLICLCNDSIIQNRSNNTKRAIWICFIPLIIQTIVSIVCIYFVGKSEINSFIFNPNHLGFVIPIITVILSIILLVLFIITLVITLVMASNRRKSIANT